MKKMMTNLNTWLSGDSTLNNAQLILLLMIIFMFLIQFIIMAVQYTNMYNKYIDVRVQEQHE